eukprot:SAG31_NODE_2687_length_5245_cov_1.854676_3_plen_96_part_00
MGDDDAVVQTINTNQIKNNSFAISPAGQYKDNPMCYDCAQFLTIHGLLLGPIQSIHNTNHQCKFSISGLTLVLLRYRGYHYGVAATARDTALVEV